MRTIIKEFATKPQHTIDVMNERSLMTPAGSTARSNQPFAFSGPLTPQVGGNMSINVPTISLPTPRRLSESREYYTAQNHFSGSPRNLKVRLQWQLGGSTYTPDGGFRLSKASAVRNITAESQRQAMNASKGVTQNSIQTAKTTKRQGKSPMNVTLPQKFFGGNTFHSRQSNWDPFSAVVLQTTPGEGPYRRGMGSPRNASTGLTEYSAQLYTRQNSRENLNSLEDPLDTIKKVVGK